jgi:hypothetical protein
MRTGGAVDLPSGLLLVDISSSVTHELRSSSRKRANPSDVFVKSLLPLNDGMSHAQLPAPSPPHAFLKMARTLCEVVAWWVGVVLGGPCSAVGGWRKLALSTR